MKTEKCKQCPILITTVSVNNIDDNIESFSEMELNSFI